VVIAAPSRVGAEGVQVVVPRIALLLLLPLVMVVILPPKVMESITTLHKEVIPLSNHPMATHHQHSNNLVATVVIHHLHHHNKEEVGEAMPLALPHLNTAAMVVLHPHSIHSHLPDQ